MADKNKQLQQMLTQYKQCFSKFYKSSSYGLLDNDGEVLHFMSSAGKFPMSPAESHKDSNIFMMVNNKKEIFKKAKITQDIQKFKSRASLQKLPNVVVHSRANNFSKDRVKSVGELRDGAFLISEVTNANDIRSHLLSRNTAIQKVNSPNIRTSSKKDKYSVSSSSYASKLEPLNRRK